MPMTMLLRHRIVPELVALWLVEMLSLILALLTLQALGIWHGLQPGGAGALATGAQQLNQAIIIACVFGFISLSVGLYRIDICADCRRLVVATLLAALSSGIVIHLFTPLLTDGGQPQLAQDAIPPLLWLICTLLSRALLNTVLRQRLLGRPVLLVGDPARGARLIRAIQDLDNGQFAIPPGNLLAISSTPPFPTPPYPTAAHLRAQRIWAVIQAADTLDPQLAQLCRQSGIRLFDDRGFWERRLGRIDLADAEPAWFVPTRPGVFSMLDAAFRRCADIGTSLLLLAFTLPVLALTALAIRLDSPGPVLYRQIRVGLHGRPFTVLKFRSMRLDAEAGGTAIWASQDDPRATRVGGFIRRTRIDELPQLFNVLRGEMGFIGPRPERPAFVAELSAAIPLYSYRACVKPGITGWAQVSYRYGASVEDARQKLSYDLYYIKYRSLLLDLLILLATIRVILFGEGAR